MEDPQKRTVTTYGPLADPHTDKTPDQVNESVSCQKSSGEMNIPVIFCFDGNLVRQVRVAAASLLDTRGTVHYHIYCVCTEDAMETESELRAVCERRDPDSESYTGTQKVMRSRCFSIRKKRRSAEKYES